MQILYIILITNFFLASLEAFQSPSNCGLRPLYNGHQRIVNGAEAIAGDWAWDLAIKDWNFFICGGVLIDEQWILSAAHCFDHNDAANSLTIDIGVHNRLTKNPWTKTFRAEKVIRHEKYIPFQVTYDYDVALVKLTTKVNFDNKYFIPACLPDNDSMNFDSQNLTAWVTGWGSTVYGGPATNEKRQVEMKINSDSKCKAYYNQVYNTQTHICAGEFSGNNGNGACYGDSGGPFVRQMEDKRWYLIGLTSWGYNCGKGTVFTRVTYFLDWIKSKINNN